MTYISPTCVACEATALDHRPALVAPFVAARVFNRSAELCRVSHCQQCGLTFFEQRYTDAEAGRLYSGYRSAAYFEVRNKWEPWYTKAVNDGLGAAEELAQRRQTYRHVVAKAQASVQTVLDYGGDRGQLMAEGPGTQHFVFDISGVTPEPGVTGFPDAAALHGKSFDLVLLCEVLEHVSEPLKYLREVSQHVEKNGLLYVTVPNREFDFADIPAGEWYRKWLRRIASNHFLLLAMDFWSTAFRIKFGTVPPLGFVKMHEHINTYDQKSLSTMLTRAGFTVLTCETCRSNKGLLALCRRDDGINRAR